MHAAVGIQQRHLADSHIECDQVIDISKIAIT